MMPDDLLQCHLSLIIHLLQMSEPQGIIQKAEDRSTALRRRWTQKDAEANMEYPDAVTPSHRNMPITPTPQVQWYSDETMERFA